MLLYTPSQNSDGDPSGFVLMLLEQSREESQAFVAEIAAQLRGKRYNIIVLCMKV